MMTAVWLHLYRGNKPNYWRDDVRYQVSLSWQMSSLNRCQLTAMPAVWTGLGLSHWLSLPNQGRSHMPSMCKRGSVFALSGAVPSLSAYYIIHQYYYSSLIGSYSLWFETGCMIFLGLAWTADEIGPNLTHSARQQAANRLAGRGLTGVRFDPIYRLF